MSRLTDPVGPHSKRVYRRRRIVVLSAVVLIPTIVVLLLVFKPGSSGGVTETKTVEVPKDLNATPTKTTEAADLPGCKKSNIDVTAVASKQDYAAGENPEIWMTISNTGKSPCVIDLGTKELSYEITSGQESYWKSTDCQQEADSREVILEPSNPLSVEKIAWDRTRSAPETCAAERPPVPAGGATYNVYATANGVKSATPWSFLLY